MNTVRVNFACSCTKGSKEVFGMCKVPNKKHCMDIFPKLKEAGVSLIRTDLYPEAMIPVTKCSSIEDYKNNVNNIQNPDNWCFDHMFSLDFAKMYGMKTMMVMCHFPEWLSYSGTYKGVPKDWDVYEDIIGKAYSKLKDKIDYCEILNEIVYFLDLTGSPYTDKRSASADIYYHVAKAIRTVNPEAVIGGIATEGPFAEELDYLFSDDRLRHESNMFNFVSYHNYTTEDCSKGSDAIKQVLAKHGYDKSTPIYVDEWNVTPQWDSNEEKLFCHKSLPYAGKNLAYFMQAGVRGCFFGNYARNYPSDGYHEIDGKTTLATYEWNDQSGSGELLPMMDAFRIASNKLSLGEGDYDVMATETPEGLTAAVGAINAKHNPVVYLVNERPIPIDVDICMENISFDIETQFVCSLAYRDVHEEKQILKASIKDKETTLSLTLPPFSVVGIIAEGKYKLLKGEM